MQESQQIQLQGDTKYGILKRTQVLTGGKKIPLQKFTNNLIFITQHLC